MSKIFSFEELWEALSSYKAFFIYNDETGLSLTERKKNSEYSEYNKFASRAG